QSSLFLETLFRRECHVGGDVAVACVDDVDVLPLEAFRGVDRREDEVVVVEAWWAAVVRTRERRVEDELGDEAFEARRGCGRTDQLIEVDQARLPIGVGSAD